MARPRSVTYDDKRQRILDQAAALFARQGFAATSIAEIAAASNASKALIYHYYSSKQAMLFDMLDQHVAHLVTVTEAALVENDPPAVRLKRLLVALMAVYSHARDRHIVLMNAIGALPAPQRQIIIDLQNRMVHDIAALVAELHQSAHLREPERRTAPALALMGMINWTYTWFNENGPITTAEFGALAAEIFLHGISSLTMEESNVPSVSQGV